MISSESAFATTAKSNVKSFRYRRGHMNSFNEHRKLFVQTYGKTSVTYAWWAGNSGVASRSGKFLAAHLAHAGLIMFWAGSFTLWELARYDPSLPMGHQSLILLPHLATLGMGMGDGGVIVDTSNYIEFSAFHLISSAILAAGGLLHSVLLPGDLGKANGRAKKFDFEWNDANRLTFILGHHLLFLGFACIAFVDYAKHHGIWDTSIGAVRTVQANLDFGHIWNYQATFLSISSLEDVMGGHTFLAFLLLFGGVFHIVSKPYGIFSKISTLSGESILSYSIAGVALMAFVTSFWCSVNTTIYPVEFFGETLGLSFGFSPYFSDTVSLPDNMHTARAWLANSHFYLGFFFLQGHFWHALRAMGFDFRNIEKALDDRMDDAKMSA